MRTIVLAAAAALLTWAGPAAAQTADTPVQAGVEAPPDRGDGHARRMALVEAYFEVIGFHATMNQMTASLIDAQLQAVTRGSEVDPERLQLVREVMGESAAALRPEIMNRLLPLYADEFTEVELEAMVAFYGSEIGRSITRKSQVVAGRSGAVMEEIMVLAAEDLRERLCARIECPAD